MTPEGLAGVPARFWSEARASPRRLLALDYDGTLAPFAVDPARAVPLPGTLATLRRILAGGSSGLAILSGRPCADVSRLLESLPVPIVGEHGWSVLLPGGALLRHTLPDGLTEWLDAAEAAAGRRVAPARIERKRTSLVVHTRGLDAGAAAGAEARARALLAELPASSAVELRAIDGGVELRALGRDKGVALAELAARFAPGTFVAALGDDETDEDAFRAAAALGGWGVRVGAPRPSAARARLASPAEVAVFLAAWSERVDRVAGAADRAAAGQRRP